MGDEATALLFLVAASATSLACGAKEAILLASPDAGTSAAAATPVDPTPVGTPGVGDPCTPDDEQQPYFGSYAFTEVNLANGFPGCATGLCLVNHYQGRVSCPQGQSAGDGGCMTTPDGDGGTQPVAVPVKPACSNRTAHDSVYCSCRCAGPDPDASYCQCGAGFTCSELVGLIKEFGLEYTGSYCIRSGTEYNPNFQCAP